MLGGLFLVKASGEQTGGAFGLTQTVLPAGFATPYHLHHKEDEAYYVLEGEVTFYVGGDKLKAGAETYVYGPREVPHGFAVEGPSPARMLLLNTPAGFEAFHAEVGEAARELTLPPAGPPDMEKLATIVAKYDIEILGPLLEGGTFQTS